MTPGSFVEIAGVWVAAFLTLAVFSFLFKDNPFYKVAEHIVVGVSAGYWLVTLATTSFSDYVLLPLKKDLSEGGPFTSGAKFGGFLLDLVPVVLGIMLLLRLVPGAAWVGRYSIALVLGVGAGLAIPTAIGNFVIRPLRATLMPIVPSPWSLWLSQHWPGSFLVSIGEALGLASPPGAPIDWPHALNNFVIVGGTFCGIVYFFFSKEHKGLTGRAANLGIMILMIGFGSTFGFTVMSRVSLLLGRFEFLLNRWLLDSFWHLLPR